MKGTIDKVWEEIHSSQEWGQYPSEPVIRFVARNFYKVPDRTKTRILDFGVGGGAHTWYLAREGFDVYGFDGSPSAVKKATGKLEKEKLCAKLVCSTGQDIEYAESFFDAIIDSCCIYANYFGDIVLMYTKCFRFLKPGGKFYTAAFGQKTTGYGTGSKLEDDTYTNLTTGRFTNIGKLHFFTKENLISLLCRIGFANVSCATDLYMDNDNTIELLIATGERQQ